MLRQQDAVEQVLQLPQAVHAQLAARLLHRRGGGQLALQRVLERRERPRRQLRRHARAMDRDGLEQEAPVAHAAQHRRHAQRGAHAIGALAGLAGLGRRVRLRRAAFRAGGGLRVGAGGGGWGRRRVLALIPAAPVVPHILAWARRAPEEPQGVHRHGERAVQCAGRPPVAMVLHRGATGAWE